MKPIFVSHPFGGKEENKDAIARICRQILKNGDMPFSPVHCFSWLDDHKPEERKSGLQGALELLKLCDEVWVYGPWEHSPGCLREVALARELGKPIVFH